jgi:hypothetical protein
MAAMNRATQHRIRGSALLAAVVLAAVAASAAASASLSQPAPVPAEQQLQAEIDGMIAAGLDPHHPKVEMLREDLAALRSGATAPTPEELGVDPGAVVDAARAAESADGAPDRAAAAEPTWDSGPVECEVVPGLLGPDEVAGAACVSVPQPDGTSRYLAIAADGTVRAVLFGPDGQIRRLTDFSLAAPAAPDATFTPTAEGDLEVAPPGQAPTVVDVR